MSLAITYSRATLGIDSPLITVETHLSNGLPAFTLVGLPETAVKESRDRVRSAIINSHFEFPDRRITINLAPAELPKEGSRFDLAIAIGILAASNQVPKDQLENYEFIGELALSGDLRYVSGLLSALIQHERSSSKGKSRALILPTENAPEATLPIKARSYLFNHILEVSAHLNGKHTQAATQPLPTSREQKASSDIQDVRGQLKAKRALTIAAAGGHNLLFSGPPGTGKTMLASRLATLLPPLKQSTAVEVAAIHSQAGYKLTGANWRKRPFRKPHHTASAVALVGGGSNPKPGEISLAHGGVLFLDELPEFDRKVLEVLREPLESGSITISRAAKQVDYPSRFQLIAAMNPCPCGYYGDGSRSCRCSAAQIQRYRNKISGPLLDRIDIHVGVARVSTEELLEPSTSSSRNSRTLIGPSSAEIARSVLAAHKIQFARQQCMNSELESVKLFDAEFVSEESLAWLGTAVEKLEISARAFHRILRIGRTIADLDLAENQTARTEADKLQSSPIKTQHLKEALSFRPQIRAR